MRPIASPTTSFTSSGSSRSPSEVEPTTSANRAVTTFRSSRTPVAITSRRVLRRKEPRRAVVDEVALVDRLEADCEPLCGERREHRNGFAFGVWLEGRCPETALSGCFTCDLVPHG